MKIAIIREGKVPPDSRVPLSPSQCAHLRQELGLDLVVQPSPGRCFTDEDYRAAGIPLTDDLSDRDLLLGVKEVPIDMLIPNKTYCFFSHTIKEQVYNRPLLQAILSKNIHLVDYEVLTNEAGKRLIAFGKFAGMVGAHNALLTYGRRTGQPVLKRMKDHLDYAEAVAYYKDCTFPAVKIVLTGNGRVANGAALVLRDMGIEQLTPEEYLAIDAPGKPVFTQLACKDYAARIDGSPFQKEDFYQHPKLFKSIFDTYTSSSDIMINGIYWDNDAPAFFTKEEMRQEQFRISVIADVTCDIAPISSIPSTLRPSTIADPFFGYDPVSEQETAPFQGGSVDMMTIDNLPNELPRDASVAFGQQFIDHILPEFLGQRQTGVIERASIAQAGELGPHFQYLADYVAAVS
ncbi:MAG: NAD(P)-dependent oxidoreductase [Bacteroidota bacterium]